MSRILIVTGGNRGLGESFVELALKSEDTIVISISRSISDVQIIRKSNNFIHIKHDLSEGFNITILEPAKTYLENASEIYFINNASVILPIKKIGEFDSQEISNSLKVNVEFPINLINYLMNEYLNRKLCFVNISSGAGNKPLEFWSLYSASKSYLINFFKALSIETEENTEIGVFSIDPGVLDTDMQGSIRDNFFPRQEYFKNLKKEGKLISPKLAAMNIFNEIKF